MSRASLALPWAGCRHPRWPSQPTVTNAGCGAAGVSGYFGVFQNASRAMRDDRVAWTGKGPMGGPAVQPCGGRTPAVHWRRMGRAGPTMPTGDGLGRGWESPADRRGGGPAQASRRARGAWSLRVGPAGRRGRCIG
jgi:hypothetical protein